MMKKNFRKMIGAFALVCTIGLAEYSMNNTVNAATADGTEQLDGGWEANQGSLSLSKNKAAKSAFKKAVNGLVGYTYHPIAYLGSQVVAGNNYSYLCKGAPVVPKAKTEYFVLNIYEDLNGKTEITGIHNLLKVNSKANGWKFNQGKTKNAKVNSDFKKAMKNLLGAVYSPIAYVGKQKTKSGINYAVFCSKKVVVPNAKRAFSMVIINKKSNKVIKIKKIQDVSLAVPDKK